MSLSAIIPALIQYGVGTAIAGILLWILHKILHTFMKGLEEDRKNYMKIIESQTIHANNHIAHLDDSVKEQSRAINTQGEQIKAGFNRTVEAIHGQTEIMKAIIKKE